MTQTNSLTISATLPTPLTLEDKSFDAMSNARSALIAARDSGIEAAAQAYYIYRNTQSGGGKAWFDDQVADANKVVDAHNEGVQKRQDDVKGSKNKTLSQEHEYYSKDKATANDNAAGGGVPPGGLHDGPRPISRYSDDALRNLLTNYNKRGVSEGGIFSRQEVQMELFRRECLPYDGYTIVALIKDLANASENGFVTYQTLWRALNPNDAGWGPYAIRQCMKAMGAANYFCARANLPFVATLIVCADTSMWSEQAVQAIASTAEMLGVLAQQTADDFVLNEAVKSLNFVA